VPDIDRDIEYRAGGNATSFACACGGI